MFAGLAQLASGKPAAPKASASNATAPVPVPQQLDPAPTSSEGGAASPPSPLNDVQRLSSSSSPASPHTRPASASSPTLAPAPPPAVVILRLRSAGEPVTLFGETDADRWARLQAVEEAAELRRVQYMADDDLKEDSLQGSIATHGDAAARVVSDVQQSATVKVASLSPELAVKVNRFVFARLSQWCARWMLSLKREDPAVVRQIRQRLVDLRPLMTALEAEACPANLLECLRGITVAVEVRNFVAAENAYFDLAIGHESWRVGFYGGTMHESYKTTKLHRGQLKHVLNDESVRRAMQAVKVLLSHEAVSQPKAG